MKVSRFCIGMTLLALLSVGLHAVPIEKEGDFNSNLEKTPEEDQVDDNVQMIFWFWDNSDDDKDAANGYDKDDSVDRYDKDVKNRYDGDDDDSRYDGDEEKGDDPYDRDDDHVRNDIDDNGKSDRDDSNRRGNRYGIGRRRDDRYGAMCICDDNSRYDADDDDSGRSRHRIGRGGDCQNELDLDTDEEFDEDARKVIDDSDLCDEDDDDRGRNRHRVGWRRGRRFDGCVCDGNNQYDRDDDEDSERNLYGTGKIVHRQFDRDLDGDDDVGGDDNDDGDALWDIARKVRRVNMLRRDRGRHAYADGEDYDDGSFHLN